MGIVSQTNVVANNDIGLDGIEFVEFSVPPRAKSLHQLFTEFGFSLLMKHKEKSIELYSQNEITFLFNQDPNSFAVKFASKHGPCISAMGWRVKNAKAAFDLALQRGAKPYENGDYCDASGKPIYAIYGIGDSLIYFIDQYGSSALYEKLGFAKHPKPNLVSEKGFLVIDHLTNNVYKGTMDQWAKFYKEIFGFVEVRYFDIRGKQTGLTSYALRSPCGKFCIPINEADEKKSQINEYLEEYNGPGVQHLAFLTKDLLKSLREMERSSVKMLDIIPSYYDTIFSRVPNVTESHDEIKQRSVLVDGDSEGYLLQIFTKNIVGPIFIELIQRKNHLSFGEGNFKALFESIERDQEKRGVFKN